ncbi:hypothetical protein KC336_g12 [Hortaea werneckii]|nr:hypothetical protein KC336_g12 [Hortaea werneckii]
MSGVHQGKQRRTFRPTAHRTLQSHNSQSPDPIRLSFIASVIRLLLACIMTTLAPECLKLGVTYCTTSRTDCNAEYFLHYR